MIETDSKINLTSFLFPNEPTWFTNLRKKAFEKLQTTKDPRFAKVDYRDWGLGETPANAVATDENMKLVDQSTREYILCPIALALVKHEKLFQTYYMKKALTEPADRLTNFSTAFVNAGNFLYIPKQAQLDEPIMLDQIDLPENSAEISHNLLVLGEGAKATICLAGDAKQTASKIHRITEIVLEANSQLTLINVDSFSTEETVYVNRQAYVGENAKLNWTIGSFSDGKVVAEMNAELVGRRATATINNAAITSGNQIQGMNTRLTNLAPYTVGKIRQRGVILDQSRLVFNGIGKIVHGAHGTIAEQENRILMLSDQASGDANPILLIDENDVVAGHAASVGRLDKKQLYYLMSRGLPKATAKRLVVRGFIGSFAKEIQNQQARETFRKVLERKLTNG
ncbi:Fe-S cluster assembly protein SufD [Pediococcus sp. M21F004]|uniref:Fe-S cluster assembly protein SufD n=1 Tax=Pediococcus sp. M21F004 TaxID=3390033 RepID=UPI003DA7A0FF